MKTGAPVALPNGTTAPPFDPATCRQVYTNGTTYTGIEAADAKLAALPAGVTGAPSPVLTQVFSGSVVITPQMFGISSAEDPRASMPTIPHASFKVIDCGCGWDALETAQGVYNPVAVAKLDSIVEYCYSRGIDVVYSHKRTPAWAGVTGSNYREPASATYYNNFLAWMYARYGTKIGYYEGWNEPNITGWFTGTTANLLTHQTMLYNAVKAQNPSLKVLSPVFDELRGVASDTLNLSAYLAAGGGSYFDIVAHHWYRFQNINEQIPVNFPYGRLMFNRAISAALFATLAANGVTGKEVWCTEVGYSTPSRANLAEAVVFLASQGVTRNILYSWDLAGWPDMRLNQHIEDYNAVRNLLLGKTLTAVNVFGNGDFGFVIDGVGYLSSEI